MQRHRRRAFRAHSGAVVPLLFFTWVAVGLGLHLTGWEVLPSSAGDLAGPPVAADISTAVLDIQLEGEVALDVVAGLLYEVSPMQTGGDIAPARSSEVLIGSEVTVRLREGSDPGWFGSGGWSVSLSDSPDWSVIVRAARLDADLTNVRLNSLRVEADGRIRLDTPNADVPIHLGGEIVLEVPSDASVEVSGPARVGSGWEVTAAGKRYQGTGEARYLVEVGSGSDVVVEQW